MIRALINAYHAAMSQRYARLANSTDAFENIELRVNYRMAALRHAKLVC
jgi:hypothetical protein